MSNRSGSPIPAGSTVLEAVPTGSSIPGTALADRIPTHWSREPVEGARTVGFWMADFSTGRVAASPGFHGICGSTPLTYARTRDFVKFVHAEDLTMVERIYDLVASGQPTEREFRMVAPDGTIRWIAMKSQPVLVPGTGATRAIGSLTSLTGTRPAVRPALPDPGPGTHCHRALTGSEIRGARGLLNWSIPDLADAAGISISTIKRLEVDAPEAIRGPMAFVVRGALEEAGVEFLPLPDGRSAQALRRVLADDGDSNRADPSWSKR